MIKGSQVSSVLRNIDRFMDGCGLSFINNFVNCITKVCIGIYRRCVGESQLRNNRNNSFLKDYWKYIDQEKDGLTCALGLVPILGSVFIRIKNAYEKAHRPVYIRLDEETTQHPNPQFTIDIDRDTDLTEVNDFPSLPPSLPSVGRPSSSLDQPAFIIKTPDKTPELGERPSFSLEEEDCEEEIDLTKDDLEQLKLFEVSTDESEEDLPFEVLQQELEVLVRSKVGSEDESS